MPRRNHNVRTRNLPRAAQREPRRTSRAQFEVREDLASSVQNVGATDALDEMAELLRVYAK